MLHLSFIKLSAVSIFRSGIIGIKSKALGQILRGSNDKRMSGTTLSFPRGSLNFKNAITQDTLSVITYRSTTVQWPDCKDVKRLRTKCLLSRRLKILFCCQFLKDVNCTTNPFLRYSTRSWSFNLVCETL